jgi:predicted ribosomally synthesized peptide with nif11-like leader
MSEVKLTKEQFSGAIQCNTADELIAYCKELGYDLSREDAEKFISQSAERELAVDNIENVAGGTFCAGALCLGCLGIGIG